MKKKIMLAAVIFISCVYAKLYRSIVLVPLSTSSDAGTAKIADFLGYVTDISIRSLGGNTKMHTIVKSPEKDPYNLTILPSGIISKNTTCYITAGVEIDLKNLLQEIDSLLKVNRVISDRFFISPKAHIMMPYNEKLDELALKKYQAGIDDGAQKGVGSVANFKRLGLGIRIGDLLDDERFKNVLKESVAYANSQLASLYNEKPFEYNTIYREFRGYADRIKQFVKEGVELDINKSIVLGKSVIIEGSQGYFSDVSFGMYPYVGTSSTTASALSAAAGVGPTRIGMVVGVLPAYMTYRTQAPFPTEILNSEITGSIVKNVQRASGESVILQSDIKQKAKDIKIEDGLKAKEVRYGWIDIVMLREAITINGIDALILTKLDALDGLDEIKICIDYTIDGKSCDYMPSSISVAKKIAPRYITMSGWKSSTRTITKFLDLPLEARNFIKKIEALLSTPVCFVSVGPARHEMIKAADHLLPF